MASTLQKITARAKRIRKAHPGKKWLTAVKEAGREFRAGKLKPKRARPKKHSKRKHKARRRVSGFKPNTGLVPREQVARTRARVGSHRRKPRRRAASPRPKRRRVGQSNGNGSGPSSTNWVMPVLVLGGLGLAAYALLRNQGQTSPAVSSSQYVPTGNAYRDSAASKILAYATAAGMVGDAIAKLIQALNRSSDADINQVYDSINSGSGIPWDFVA